MTRKCIQNITHEYYSWSIVIETSRSFMKIQNDNVTRMRALVHWNIGFSQRTHLAARVNIPRKPIVRGCARKSSVEYRCTKGRLECVPRDCACDGRAVRGASCRACWWWRRAWEPRRTWPSLPSGRRRRRSGWGAPGPPPRCRARALWCHRRSARFLRAREGSPAGACRTTANFKRISLLVIGLGNDKFFGAGYKRKLHIGQLIISPPGVNIFFYFLFQL